LRQAYDYWQNQPDCYPLYSTLLLGTHTIHACVQFKRADPLEQPLI